MTTTENTSPADVLAETIDQTRYEVVQEIRRMGQRVQEAISDYEEIAASARRALADRERPLGGIRAVDNPVELLRDMEGLSKVALLIGVPEACITNARRGEFVSVLDYMTAR